MILDDDDDCSNSHNNQNKKAKDRMTFARSYLLRWSCSSSRGNRMVCWELLWDSQLLASVATPGHIPDPTLVVGCLKVLVIIPFNMMVLILCIDLMPAPLVFQLQAVFQQCFKKIGFQAEECTRTLH